MYFPLPCFSVGCCMSFSHNQYSRTFCFKDLNNFAPSQPEVKPSVLGECGPFSGCFKPSVCHIKPFTYMAQNIL